jgi:Fe-S-cluster containining protein
MMNKAGIAEKVRQVYDFIDSKIAARKAECNACGKCCDFNSFDHRLYVTSSEIIYFAANVDGPIRPMDGGVCPYNTDGKCSVHKNRFAGCRIFLCKGDSEFQSKLSEEAIAKFKSICAEFGVDYYYADLKAALNGQVIS